MLSKRNKRYLYQILPFGIICAFFSMVYSIIELGILGDSPTYPSTGNPFRFALIVPALYTGVIGLFVGVVEVFYLSKIFHDRSLAKKIITKFLIYISITIIITFSGSALKHATELDYSITDPRAWQYAQVFFSNFAFWSIVLYTGLGLLSCLFYSEVSSYIGLGVLRNFFTGKYHQPVEEERIFMFLDMKSSTSIAEGLGHVEYFQMLKDYYKCISDPLLDYDGEIYQYVGDEIVITWEREQGIESANCLHAFYAMKESLQLKKDHFIKNYGVQPTFKAALHIGIVTTGELGLLKKEITFTGDVLNTTARVQGLCNTYQTDLLLTGDMIEVLPTHLENQLISLGATKVRGKNEEIQLYTLN